MTDPIECPHFGRPLDFPGECTLCSGAEKKLKDEQASAPIIFATKYAGFCRGCMKPIEVGDKVAYREPGPRVHEGCWP